MDEKTQRKHLAAGRLAGWERTCRAKVDYKTEESAERAAVAMTSKFGRELEGYPCYFCHGWHIGRRMSEAELDEAVAEVEQSHPLPPDFYLEYGEGAKE